MNASDVTVFDAAELNRRYRTDGALFNTFGGMNNGGSFNSNPSNRGRGQTTPILNPVELTDLFCSSWLMAKICEAGPKEMTRKWLRVTSSSLDPDLLTDFGQYLRKKLRSAKAFRKAQTWANLYGGAVIFMGINDGLAPDQPVDVKRIQGIDYLRVMDRYEISPWFDRTVNDYIDPELYQTTGEQSLLLGANGQPLYTAGMTIHKSRILRFDGIDIPYRLRSANFGWGLSKLQRVYADYWNFVNTLDNGAQIVAKFDIFNHSIKGLSKMVETGKSGSIKAHMREVYDFLQQYGVLLTDGDVESAGFVNRNVQGLKEFIGPLQEVVTAASGMPFSILWGRIGRAGMGGSGQHDIEKEVWSETCHSDQENQFRDLVETLVEYIAYAKDGPLGGNFSDDFDVNFMPLLDPDPAEELERKNKQMLIDQGYHGMSDPDGTIVLTAKEIRDSRFAQPEFNFDTQIDTAMVFEHPLERQAAQMELQHQYAKPDEKAALAELNAKAKEKEKAKANFSKADDSTPVKRILPFHDFSIGLQYQAFDKRHGRTLPVGYGHLRKTLGADNMAVDVYVGHKLESPKIYQVTQLVNGEFDEHKYFVGFDEDKNEIATLYKSIMPPEMFGGIQEMTVSHLEKYQKSDQNDSALLVKGNPLDSAAIDPLSTITDEDLMRANAEWKDLPDQVVSSKWKHLLEPEIKNEVNP